MNIQESKIFVLDGGGATELERRGFSFLNDPLWSARVLHTSPKAVVEAHKCYLESGADIITTLSYQASITGFQKYLGVNAEQSKQLIKLSAELAKQAREEYSKTLSEQKSIFIAGSVGPYGAALADGSEYLGTYCDKVSHEELIEWHRPRIQCLVDAGVNVLAFETIPALKEAKALMKLLGEFPGTKAWLSFSSQSLHKTSRGDDINIAAQNCLQMAPAHQLIAIGVNCCPPEFAVSLLKDISAVTADFPLVVYPNSGEIWDNKLGWTGKKVIQDNSYLEAWINASAKIIGGCCQTTPDDILHISQYICKREKSF